MHDHDAEYPREVQPPGSENPSDAPAQVPSAGPNDPETKEIVVEFHSGEAVEEHPDVIPLLQNGWRVERSAPAAEDAADDAADGGTDAPGEHPARLNVTLVKAEGSADPSELS